MKVLYDHQMFSIQKYGGISRYFANLYHFLNMEDEVKASASILYTRNHYMQDVDCPLPKFIGDWLLKKDRKVYKWNKKFSKRIISGNDFDVLHPTYYNPYFLSHLKKPFVITVHDMIYELFPEFFLSTDHYIPQKREVIQRADHIIAISESTRNDIKDIFNIPEEKISVIYHGFYEEPNQKVISYEPPYHHYILYVGDRATYKNFHRFIKAISPILKKDGDLNLICTGGGSLQVAEVELLRRYGMHDRTEQVSASDQQLNELYKKARVFVFPSLYEGFGFPLLEAFNNNCPVACSNTSCFKEVGGDAVVYFDPYDTDAMNFAISSILYNQQLAEELTQKGRKQLDLFTIEKCVSETKQVYQKFVR
jgi:glycosyltransferase involved in cell wall biosynthesis